MSEPPSDSKSDARNLESPLPNPSPANEPPFNSDEVAALRAALAEAISLLAAVDSDANNVQLDIARWRRRHHEVVEND